MTFDITVGVHFYLPQFWHAVTTLTQPKMHEGKCERIKISAFRRLAFFKTLDRQPSKIWPNWIEHSQLNTANQPIFMKEKKNWKFWLQMSWSICTSINAYSWKHWTFTGWHIMLIQTSRWQENKSSVLAWPGQAGQVKTELLFWCQREVWINVMC